MNNVDDEWEKYLNDEDNIFCVIKLICAIKVKNIIH